MRWNWIYYKKSLQVSLINYLNKFSECKAQGFLLYKVNKNLEIQKGIKNDKILKFIGDVNKIK